MERRRKRGPYRLLQFNGRTLVKQLILCIFILLFIILAKWIDHAALNKAMEDLGQQLNKNYTVSDFLSVGKTAVGRLKEGTMTVVAALIDGNKHMEFTSPTDQPGTYTASQTPGNSGKSVQFEATKELQVYAIAGGTVAEIGLESPYIKISHGNDIYSLYGGCTTVYVKPLEKVKKGQMIGSVSAGEQPLLFELWIDGKLADPASYIDF